MLVAVYLMARPQEMAALPFRLLGWSLMVYAIFEAVCGIKVYRARRLYEQQHPQADEAPRQIEQADEVEYVEVTS